MNRVKCTSVKITQVSETRYVCGQSYPCFIQSILHARRQTLVNKNFSNGIEFTRLNFEWSK